MVALDVAEATAHRSPARTSDRHAIFVIRLGGRLGAEQAGTIRPGITAEDFFLAVAGLWQLDSRADW